MKQHQLGYGVGLRPPHYQWILDHKPPVGWFEIISENFLNVGGRPRHYLENIRASYPIVMHGVSLSIGATAELNWTYLRQLRELSEWLQPEWVSDHLCWTHLKGFYVHDLLPLPYTKQTLGHVAERILRVQDFLGRPLLFENPSLYVEYQEQEFAEADFFVELCRLTDCRILLDLNNLVVNQHNLGWDPWAYILRLPADRIAQLHIAGHLVRGGLRIDTHDQVVGDEVWSLFGKFVEHAGERPTLLEWDDNIPDFPVLLEQVERAQAVVRESRASDGCGSQDWVGASGRAREIDTSLQKIEHSAELRPNVEDLAALNLAQEDLLSLIRAREGFAEDHPALSRLAAVTPVPRWQGAQVYNQGFFLRLRTILGDLFPQLTKWMGDEIMDQLCADYLQACPPDAEQVKYVGRLFPDFIESQRWLEQFELHPVPLADLASLEWAIREVYDALELPGTKTDLSLLEIPPAEWSNLKFAIQPSVRILSLRWDVVPTWASLKKGDAPLLPTTRAEKTILVYRQGFEISFKELIRDQFRFLLSLKRQESLADMVADMPSLETETLASLIEFCIWCERANILSCAFEKKATAGL